MLLALASLLALITVRGYEAMLPFLAAAPITMYLCRPQRSRRLLWWVVSWEAVMGLGLALALRPFWQPSPEVYYQAGFGLDARPAAVLLRVMRQFSFHLAPILQPMRELLSLGVLLAGLVFGGAFWLAWRGEDPPGQETRVRLGLLLAIGVLWAALAYVPFALSPSPLAGGPERTQYLSCVGIALALASAFRMLSGPLPPRWRTTALGLLGAWVVLLGAARTAALQAEWDRHSVFAAQRQVLAELTRQAPGLAPATLVLLIDEAGSFPASFGFRHAVEYLYPGQATGYVWNARDRDLFYPTAFTPGGVLTEPWSIVREAWHVPPRRHRYDEVVVVRHTRDGQVQITDEWPPELPPLPPGAAYAPRARIRPDTTKEPRERNILR